jgi:hypothetical protein
MKNWISRKHLPVPSPKKRGTSITLAGLFLIPALITSLLITVLPSRWLPVNLWVDSDNKIAFLPESENSVDDFDPVTYQQKNRIVDLMIEKKFWKNRLAMSKADSLVISLDLVDSVLTLEVKGVILRTCQLQKYDMNIDLRNLKKHPNLTEWLDEPFTLQYDSSSIPKVPFKVIQAPKDSIEAQAVINKILSTTIEEDIHYSLHFNRNLRIDIAQFQVEGITEPQYSNLLYLDDQSIDFLTKVFSPKNLPTVSAELNLRIFLSQSDARAIYRALPKHTSLAIRF